MDELRGLSCLVCYNAFSSINNSNIPRNLICGHTFCTACLERLAQQYHGLYVQCPTCKCQTLLQTNSPAHGIKALPKNFGVLEIIECREGKSPGSTKGKTVALEVNKDKTRHKCEEHDEAKKVYCYTDECLICIYCQIYGKHQGHKCDLASDLAKSCRTELNNLTEKLKTEVTKMKEGRETISTMKTLIVRRQKFLKEQVKKVTTILKDYLASKEAKLNAAINDMSYCKLQALAVQEKTLNEFCIRCEELCLLIKTLQNDSDISVIEGKPNIENLIDGMLSVAQACQLKPQAQNNIMFQCNEDIVNMMEKSIGDIQLLEDKDEEQDAATAGKDGELLLTNVVKKLESEVYATMEQDHVEQDETSDEDDWVSVDSIEEDEEEDEDVEVEEEEEEAENDQIGSPAEADDDDPTSEGELVGAVGGNMLPEAQQDERPKPDKEINKKQGLLRELQHEIERLRLLGPRGDVIRVVDDETSSSSDSDHESGDDENQSVQLELQITVNNDLGGVRPKTRVTTTTARQATASTSNNMVQSDHRHDSHIHKRKHCSVNCHYHLKPTLQCKNCLRVFCKSCAPLALLCNKSENGHEYVSFRNSPNTKRCRSHRELKWECKLCTMVNEGHVLVCGACETSKDYDPNEVRNVCPMCTLVNEPGKTNCELCDTDLEETM